MPTFMAEGPLGKVPNPSMQQAANCSEIVCVFCVIYLTLQIQFRIKTVNFHSCHLNLTFKRPN